MIPRPDFVVTATDGRPLLAVEAYAVSGVDPAITRRDYLEAVPAARYSMYFLLVCKDRMYLWRSDRPDDASPDFCGDTRSALAPLVDEERAPFDDLRGPVFEMFVSAWLSALAYRDFPSEYFHAQRWLSSSGIYDLIRGAEIEMPAAA